MRTGAGKPVTELWLSSYGVRLRGWDPDRTAAGVLADADEYIAGRIDSDELVARARARYGLA
jgi:hypothetical protein